MIDLDKIAQTLEAEFAKAAKMPVTAARVKDKATALAILTDKLLLLRREQDGVEVRDRLLELAR